MTCHYFVTGASTDDAPEPRVWTFAHGLNPTVNQSSLKTKKAQGVCVCVGSKASLVPVPTALVSPW